MLVSIRMRSRALNLPRDHINFVLAPRYRVELLNIGNQLKGAYVVSTGEKLPCRALKCCEGNSMIEVELPEKLQGAKNYCVCLELEEEEPIFEAIID